MSRFENHSMERRESERVEQIGSNGNTRATKIAYCIVINDVSINEGCSIGPRLECSSDVQSDGCLARQVSALRNVAMRDHEGRYTQQILSQMLQFIGCKPRRADKVCKKIFLILEQRALLSKKDSCYGLSENLEMVHPGLFSLQIEKNHFLQLIMDCLGDHPGNLHPDVKMSNLRVACSIQERRDCVIVLLCGTSGTGKSTLASLVSSRLGISCVISTDAVRHMLRGFCSKKDAPAMWKSTYDASDVPVADGASLESGFDRGVMETYMHQSKIVLENVEHLVASYSMKCLSIVIEGVHLSPEFAINMMRQYANVVPFLVHISNKSKHLERFSVRAKAMTLRPESNRYVKYLESIRTIQQFLRNQAKRVQLPQVDNTNVDRSLAAIHTTVLGALRMRYNGHELLDEARENCKPLLEIFNESIESSWRSSDILKQIKKKGGVMYESPSTSVTSTTGTVVGWDKKPASVTAGYSDLGNYYSSHYDSQPDAMSAPSSVSAQRSTEGTNQELEIGSILYPETSDDEKH